MEVSEQERESALNEAIKYIAQKIEDRTDLGSIGAERLAEWVIEELRDRGLLK